MITRGELEIIKAWANKGCFTPQTLGHLESLIQHAEETIGGEVKGQSDDLRDRFAAAALTGVKVEISLPLIDSELADGCKVIAKAAYAIADAMLAARTAGKGKEV